MKFKEWLRVTDLIENDPEILALGFRNLTSKLLLFSSVRLNQLIFPDERVPLNSIVMLMFPPAKRRLLSKTKKPERALFI